MGSRSRSVEAILPVGETVQEQAQTLQFSLKQQLQAQILKPVVARRKDVIDPMIDPAEPQPGNLECGGWFERLPRLHPQFS